MCSNISNDNYINLRAYTKNDFCKYLSYSNCHKKKVQIVCLRKA
jgi:hypothetical protein